MANRNEQTKQRVGEWAARAANFWINIFCNAKSWTLVSNQSKFRVCYGKVHGGWMDNNKQQGNGNCFVVVERFPVRGFKLQIDRLLLTGSNSVIRSVRFLREGHNLLISSAFWSAWVAPWCFGVDIAYNESTTIEWMRSTNWDQTRCTKYVKVRKTINGKVWVKSWDK